MTNEWNDLNDLLASDPSARAAAMGMTAEEMDGLMRLRAMEPWSNPRYASGDVGNGHLFADFYQDTVRYVRGRGCWFVYGDGRWIEDREGLKAMERFGFLARLMLLLSAEITDHAQRTAAWKRAERLTLRTPREAALKDARAVYPLDMADFDRDPWLFNCPNGTLDLKTGLLREHRADDYLTRMAGAAYDPSAACPRWDGFIREIMAEPDDGQMSLAAEEAVARKARYLQKMMGYALTGDTRLECFFLLYGPSTRNGKGTLMETIIRMMGTYARTARPETLCDRPANGSAPTEDVARLSGARLVSISEPERAMPLSASLVKRLTGNDTITARFLHQGSFEFRPAFKIFMNANDLPPASDQTLFLSGRVRVLPFRRHFAAHQQDQTLKALFAEPRNLSAVLNWCMAGLRLLEAEGLGDIEEVRIAADAYRREMDVVQLFMDECMKEDAGVKTRLKDVYMRYRAWCAANGYPPDNAGQFKRWMGNRARIAKERPTSGGCCTNVVRDYSLIPVNR